MAVTSLSVAVLALALAFVPWVEVLAVLLALAGLVRDAAQERAAASAPTPPPASASPSAPPAAPPSPSPAPGPSASERDPFTDPAPGDLYGEANAPRRSASIRDYEVTVSGVRPAAGRLEGGEQVECVAFDLTVVNTSDGVRDVAGDLGITILDQDLGRYVEQRCADLLPPQEPRSDELPAAAVPPGERVSGTVCEDVPADVVPGAVLPISVSDGDRVSGSTWALGAGSDPAP